MKKWQKSPFTAAHAAHHTSAPSAVHQAFEEGPFSAAHAAQEASASQATHPATHSRRLRWEFQLPMHVPTQRHVERWSASSSSQNCRRPIKRNKGKIKGSRLLETFKSRLISPFFHSFHSFHHQKITRSRKTTEISSQKHLTIMGSIFISSMFLFSPLMCN